MAVCEERLLSAWQPLFRCLSLQSRCSSRPPSPSSTSPYFFRCAWINIPLIFWYCPNESLYSFANHFYVISRKNLGLCHLDLSFLKFNFFSTQLSYLPVWLNDLGNNNSPSRATSEGQNQRWENPYDGRKRIHEIFGLYNERSRRYCRSTGDLFFCWRVSNGIRKFMNNQNELLNSSASKTKNKYGPGIIQNWNSFWYAFCNPRIIFGEYWRKVVGK